MLAEVADLGDKLKAAEAELTALQEAVSEISLGLPNIPHESVPNGRDEIGQPRGAPLG